MEQFKFKAGNNHLFICGLTQHGKSHFAKDVMLNVPYPVVYFNIQGESVPKGFVTVYSDQIETRQLLDMLHDGLKINLVFSDTRKGYKLTAGYVIDVLMKAGYTEENPMYMFIDECHLLKSFSLEMAVVVATAGLKKGVRCGFVTQRPAQCHKALYTQSLEHYMFYLNQAESVYMKGKGIDFEKCREEWKRLGEYSFCFYNGYELIGYPPIK